MGSRRSVHPVGTRLWYLQGCAAKTIGPASQIANKISSPRSFPPESESIYTYQQKISAGGSFSPAVSEPAVARRLGQSASKDSEG